MTHSEKALEFINDGHVVGLGTGAAATDFIHALGKAVQGGLRVRGVPTSQKSAALAQQLGIPLATLAEVNAEIDVTVDGADEVDRDLNLIKGLGGALVREKIVAAASRQFVVLIGPDNVQLKDTGTLGTRGVLPVEVVPFALPLVLLRLNALGLNPQPRLAKSCDQGKGSGSRVQGSGSRGQGSGFGVQGSEGVGLAPSPSSADHCPLTPDHSSPSLFLSDNGNYILDCRIGPVADPAALEHSLRTVPGVIDTGLFLGMASVVLIQNGDRLDVRYAKSGAGGDS